MTTLSTLDKAAVFLVHTEAQRFLFGQRHERGNHQWFAVADIAAIFGEGLPMVPFLVAIRDLVATGNVEGNGEGCMRHI